MSTLGNLTATGEDGTAGFRAALKVTMPSGGGTVTKLSGYVRAAGVSTNTVKYGLYTNNSNKPGNLIVATSNLTETINETPVLLEGTVTPTFIAAGDYFIMVVLASSTADADNHRTGTIASGTAYFEAGLDFPADGGWAGGTDNTFSEALFLTYTAGGIDHLTITSIPSSVAVGESFTVVVQSRDSGGSLVSGDNSTSITLGATIGTLSGTVTRTVSSGVATFTGLTLNTAGAETIVASASGVTSGSNGITVTPATVTATKCEITSAPSSVEQVETFDVTVELRDAGDNLDDDNTANVSIATNLGSLAGATTVAAVAGVATFSNLTLNVVGSATLTVTSSGLTSDTASVTVTTVSGGGTTGGGSLISGRLIR